MKVKAYNPEFGIAASPIVSLCRNGNLPEDPSSGLDAEWGTVTFASVSQLGALAAIQLCGKTRGVMQHVDCDKSSNAFGYMQRANYFSVLGINAPEDFVRHDTSTRLLPISQIPIDELQAQPGEIATRAKELILSHVRLSKSVEDNLNLSLGEIIDNVVQHSRASAPGIACAQYYRDAGGPFVEICVADCGIGIPASMAENPDYAGKSDGDLLALAFERKTGQWYGHSKAGTHEVSGGMGLSYATSLARATGGHIWAVSHSAAVHVCAEGTNQINGLFYPGTLMVVRIPETESEVSEIEMRGEGADSPSYWNQVDGAYTESDEALW